MDGSLVTNSSLGDNSTLTTDVSSYTKDILDADQDSFCNGDFTPPCLTTTDDLVANGLYCDCVIMNAAVAGIPRSKTLDSEADGMDDDDDDDDDDEPCGWGPVRPKCCQRFRNAKMVLICLCLLAIIQGMVVNGFVSVVISTIEKRFDLTSTQSGFIASGYDIASVLCLIPVSYFGGNGNKPRWIVGGIFLLSLGSFLFALPHFLVDLYTYDTTGHHPTCHSDANGSGTTGNLFSGNTSTSNCHVSGITAPPMSHYMYVMVIAQMLHGAGATPIYTLAVTYLDENLKAKLTPMYLGVFYSTAIIGPAIGYILGGQLLKLYCDVGWVDMTKIGLSPEDPRWVGAWWIGFLISGTLALLLALPLSGFPKSLPGAEKLRAERVSEVYKGSDTAGTSAGFSGFSLKDIPASLRILFRNPTFMCLNFAGACEGLLVSGFIVFAPKFVESQFSISAAWAAQLIGFATIPSGGGGTFFGGYLVKKLNLRCVGILRLCIITTFTSLLLTFCMLARCPDMGFVGVNLEYSQRNRTLEQVNLTASCNIGCVCSSERYSPVCGSDRLTYFSPCHAGCSAIGSTDGVKVYEDCSCISAMLAEDGWVGNATAHEGKCESSCQLLTIFLPIFAMIIFVTFVTSMPALSATLRCVPEKQRSFALGIQWMLFRCLGMIPAPMLFGSLIDRACLAWQQQPCLNEKGSCFTYDNWSMGTYFLTLIFCCKGLSLGFFFIALFLYRPPPTNVDVTAVVEVHSISSPNDAWGSPPSSVRLLDSNGICDTTKIYSGQEKVMKNGATV